MECYTSRFSRQCTWQINRRRQHLTGNPSALSFKRRNHPKRKECRIGISKCSVGQDQSSVEGSERKPAAARLFSNVNTSTLKHEPGSLFGAASLVAGTAVGAGILALPYSTEVQIFLIPSWARYIAAHVVRHNNLCMLRIFVNYGSWLIRNKSTDIDFQILVGLKQHSALHCVMPDCRKLGSLHQALPLLPPASTPLSLGFCLQKST